MEYKNKLVEKSLTEMGFEEFTEIQAKTLPLIEQGIDIIGHSQTGTGKTAAFALPLLEKINYNETHIQALIICPTRELAVQVKNEIDKIGKYLPELRTVCVYGGEPIGNQIRNLKRKPQIVIGTPGRMIDHINRKLVRPNKIQYLVLDEADEMMKMGFLEDIETILEACNDQRQTVMFSATMPKPIINISKRYMNNPQVISVISDEETNKDITQYYYTVQEKHKIEAVARLIHVYNPKRTLIFCNTKSKVDQVTLELRKKDYNVNKIHGDLAQTARLQVLDAFHEGLLDILVATDVAARGLDIKGVEVVINYNVPEKADFYVHRIGRTGRIGNKGRALTLVSRREMSRLDQITRFTKAKIKKRNIPTPEKVMRVRREQQVEEINEIIQNINTNPYQDMAYELLQGNEDINVVAALLHKIEKKDVSKKVQGDINDNIKKGDSSSKSSGETVRYHLNVGRNDGLTPKIFSELVITKTGLHNKQIMDIVISERASFFTTDRKKFNQVMKSMTNITVMNKKTSIQEAKVRKGKPRRRRR